MQRTAHTAARFRRLSLPLLLPSFHITGYVQLPLLYLKNGKYRNSHMKCRPRFQKPGEIMHSGENIK
jgi:hypothetical protein